MKAILLKASRQILPALVCGWLWCAAIVPLHAAPPAPINALILVRAGNIAEMDMACDFIRSRGGHVPVTIAPTALFVEVPPVGVSDWVGQAGISAIFSSRVDADAIAAQYGEEAALAARAWNQMLAGTYESVSPATPGQDLIDDTLVAPDQEPFAPLAPSAPPSSTQTSEFLYGSVQVDVFLAESNGSINANTEDWTTAMRDSVVSEVTAGVTWWAGTATQGGRPSANLTFNLTFHTPFNEPGIVATGYEPINNNRPLSGSLLWIGDMLTNSGYPATMTGARSYVHNRRIATGRDWAFAVFIANSLNDVDGKFADGYFAYCYLYGPFLVMTYDNDGWGITRMQIVTSHEMAHAFGALDEYASSGCMDTQSSGYLNVANSNCENGTPATEDSIMRSSGSQQTAYPNHLASTPVRGMLGWRDSDGDGLYDVVDTGVQISILRTSGGTPGQPATYTGTATDIPWDSPTRADTSINKITLVRFRVDGGAWSNATASDGAFDEYSESFAVTTAALSAGTHAVEIQACNSVNNCASGSDTIVVPGGGACYDLTTNVNPGNGGSVSGNPGPNCGPQYSSGTPVALTPSAGADYVLQGWIGCDSVLGSTCNITMNSSKTVTAGFVPTNDDFGSAFLVGSPSYARSQRVDGATTAADDPSFSCATGQRSHSVWYRYTAPAQGRLIAGTFGSSYDTVVAIWTGARGALTSLACNDDFVPGSNIQSQVQVAVVPGTIYYVEISGRTAPSSPATLNFTLSFVPAHSIYMPLIGGGTMPVVLPATGAAPGRVH